jgi:hypothetical protein
MYSFNQLKTALDIVQDELIQHNFWDIKLSKIVVSWAPYSNAYGFQKYYTSGEIIIPAFSKSKFSELFNAPYVSLKDILRHEYAHAFAYTHRKLIRSKEFRLAFGTFHDDVNTSWIYDPKFFISEYASTNPMEDFAETFMYYLEYSGKLPRKFNYPIIKQKWKFIANLSIILK